MQPCPETRKQPQTSASPGFKAACLWQQGGSRQLPAGRHAAPAKLLGPLPPVKKCCQRSLLPRMWHIIQRQAHLSTSCLDSRARLATLQRLLLRRKCTPPDGHRRGPFGFLVTMRMVCMAMHVVDGSGSVAMLMAILNGHREQQTARQLQAIVPSSWAIMACTAGCSRAPKPWHRLPPRSVPMLRPSGRAQSQSQRLDATAAAISGSRLCLARWRS